MGSLVNTSHKDVMAKILADHSNTPAVLNSLTNLKCTSVLRLQEEYHSMLLNTSHFDDVSRLTDL